MPNRARNYMDRLLGRNEGNESRDFTDGRRYGEEERFYNDPFNDSQSEWNRNSEFSSDREDMYGRDDRYDRFSGDGRDGRDGRDREYQGRNHRTQASRTRPREGQYKSDSDRDYSVRRNPPQGDYMDYNPNGTTRGFDYKTRENRGSGDQNSFWNDDFPTNRDRGMGRGSNQNDSFYRGDFRNTENRNSGIGNERPVYRQEVRGGFFGKGPKGWKRSDDRIREEVSEALYRDYHVDASEIEIDVKEGIVTLSGSVDSREAKRSAEECIENLSGVVDVHNRIRVADKSNVSNLRDGQDQNEKRSLS